MSSKGAKRNATSLPFRLLEEHRLNDDLGPCAYVDCNKRANVLAVARIAQREITVWTCGEHRFPLSTFRPLAKDRPLEQQ